VVADLAYHFDHSLAEGRLTDLRKAVVNAAALARVAVDVDLGRELLLGKGEAAAGGRHKPSILSDALEAVVGAVYLDGGAGAAHDLVDRLLGSALADASTDVVGLDHKTALQELVARFYELPPVYELREEGPDHAKHFHARVFVNGSMLGEGDGRSKKSAEQDAARVACDRLREEHPVGQP
jgi:ribonuclease III